MYATREGHTRRIAQHIGAILRLRDVPAEMYDAALLPAHFGVLEYRAAVAEHFADALATEEAATIRPPPAEHHQVA